MIGAEAGTGAGARSRVGARSRNGAGAEIFYELEPKPVPDLNGPAP
jgi:hypothetical protein